MTEPITRPRLVLALVASLLLHVLLAGGLTGFDHRREYDRAPLIRAALIAPPAQPEPEPLVRPEPPPEPPKVAPKPRPARKAPVPPAPVESEAVPVANGGPAAETVSEASNERVGDEELVDQDYGEDGPPVRAQGQVLTPLLALVGEATLEFDVYRGEGLNIGQTRYHWVHDGERYQMDTVTETTGLAGLLLPLRIEQRSTGEVADTGLRPLHFVSQAKQGKATEEEVVFDWASNRVMLRAGARKSEHELVAGAQDMASLWLEMIWRAQGGGDFDFTVATGKRYSPRWFVPEQESTSLDTAIGPLLVRRLQARAQQGDNQIEVWLAPNLRWLPVRIRYTDRKGDVYDQRVRLIEYENLSLRASTGSAASAASGTTTEPATEPANPFLR